MAETRLRSSLVLAFNAAKPQKAVLARAAAAVKNGCVIAISTDLGYALAADARNPQVLLQLNRLGKGAGLDGPLCLLGYRRQALSLSEEISEEFWEASEKSWPGPASLAAKAAPWVPKELRGSGKNSGRVALRFPNFPALWEIVDALDWPLAAWESRAPGRKAVLAWAGKLPYLFLSGGRG